MPVLLGQNHDLDCYIDELFTDAALKPLLTYVNHKFETAWDDYNEFFHASKLFHQLSNDPHLSVDTHTLQRNGIIVGVLFIVRGEIKKLESKYVIEDEAKAVLLKYFHIEEKGHLYGGNWLRQIILPYYKSKGYKHIYVNSSHEKSFPFYSRLGTVVDEYEAISDNRLFTRNGRSFRIEL